MLLELLAPIVQAVGVFFAIRFIVSSLRCRCSGSSEAGQGTDRGGLLGWVERVGRNKGEQVGRRIPGKFKELPGIEC